MSKIITGFEFAILVAIVIGIAILLHVLEARRRINEARRQKHDDDLVYEEVKTHNDFKEALAHYNDTEHQVASMEPFCGEGKKTPVSVQERNAKAYEEVMGRWPEPIKLTPEQERLARSRSAVRRVQIAARDSNVRYFSEDLSKRDDEMAKVLNGIQRRVLDEQPAALDRIMGHKP